MSKLELELYDLWNKNATEDDDLIKELEEIKGNQKEIKERFYQDLAFGTAGLRGVLGAGTNRMNIYMIRKTTQAFANYLNNNHKNPSVAISYDSRIKSNIFAKEAACVLAGNNIKAYIYKQLMPVPCLSYAVRYLKCDAGIMVTASHNPAKYNGYKVYGNDGCQLTESSADKIYEISSKIDTFHGIKKINFQDGLKKGIINYISDEVEQKYLDCVKACSVHPEILSESDFKVVYTPLNGAGNKPVRKMFSQMGVKSVYIVKEQENPDGNFPTCPTPNPEIREALTLGLRDCETIKPDILVATDPDCDRMGIAVPDKEGNYVLITGNEIGALLLEYICSERLALGTLPKKPIAVKTIVSSDIVRKIADNYGVELINVLTGFKYIGEQIAILEKKGEENRFILGFEESYGYLMGSYVRDKDAVVATMLICEMTAFYRKQGKSLLDALNDIYVKYGTYLNIVDSYVFEGMEGMDKMKKLMSNIRSKFPKMIGGKKVIKYLDYLSSENLDIDNGNKTKISLPKSNVIEFRLEDNMSVIIRPSGTEPKIKVYYTLTGDTFKKAKENENIIKNDFKKYIEI